MESWTRADGIYWPRLRPPNCQRAQSHVIGVILLTAVIVLLVGGFGVVYLGAMDDGGQGPLVDAEVNATAERISITHVGGESLPLAELHVIVRVDGASDRYAFDAVNVTGDGDGEFGPSEQFARDHGLGGGQMDALVVHTASNAVVHRAYLDAGDTGATTTATFGYEPTNPDRGETVTFDASDSNGGGGIATYQWDWDGDGNFDERTSEPTVTHTFESAREYAVTLTVVDERGATDVATRSVTVGSVAPTIENTALTDGDDDLVTNGDAVTVTATVAPGSDDVTTVAADGSAFDSGDVTMTDGDGDGTYDTTFEVGTSPSEGDQSVTVVATDRAGNSASVETSSVTVDTTPPEIETFMVTDDSRRNTGWIFVEYVESFDVQWNATDDHLSTSTVSVNVSGSTQETYDEFTGDVTYENVRSGEWFGREHVIRIVAIDAASNRACRTVTDTANGNDPPDSAFEAC